MCCCWLRRKKQPDPERELALEALRRADAALEERVVGLRAVMRDLGIGVDKATLELIDTLEGRKR